MGCLQGDLHLITLVPEWPQHNTHHHTPIPSRTEQYGQQRRAEASIHWDWYHHYFSSLLASPII
jgi:hypothetical protein